MCASIINNNMERNSSLADILHRFQYYISMYMFHVPCQTLVFVAFRFLLTEKRQDSKIPLSHGHGEEENRMWRV